MTTPRILTTHTGSLPAMSPAQVRLQEILKDRAAGRQIDQAQFADLAAEAVAECVGWQLDIGIDIVSAGELDRAGFMDSSRLTNFDGPTTTRFVPMDLQRAGMLQWFQDHHGALQPRMNTGPVRHDPGPIAAELDHFLKALATHGVGPARAFLSEPSPGIIAAQGTVYYDDEDRFLEDITQALSGEYLEVARTGLTLQIDAPDLAMDWFVWHQGQSMDEYLARLARQVRAINMATDGIPPEQLRVHICHGNWPGPHNYDITLPDVIDALYELRAGTLVLELSNPRHRWERAVFGQPEHRLPDGKMLGVGVIDSCSMSVEHPETVAAALLEMTRIVGGDRIIASPDCGFRTMLDMGASPYTTELKLRSLVDGTRLASERLAGGVV